VTKLRYEIDPHNRLVVKEKDKKSGLRYFRRVLDGRFRMGSGNTLIFHAKTPAAKYAGSAALPRQIKLCGKWALTKNHDLKLALDNWRRQTPTDTLILKGEIIQAKSNSLNFALRSRTKENTFTTHTIKLEGKWQADKYNRLTFRVEKGAQAHDTLIFNTAWQINKRHEIIYNYIKKLSPSKTPRKKSIIFKGRWDIVRKSRLVYKLDFKEESRFDFSSRIEFLKSGAVKCSIGIGIQDKLRPVRRVFTLTGKWRIKKGTGLLLEIKSVDRQVYAIIFGAEASLGQRGKIRFKLKNTLGQNLGAELKLSKELLKGDVSAFLRVLKQKNEQAVYIGMAGRW